MSKILLAILLAVQMLALPSFAQLEFSNWLLDNSTMVAIDDGENVEKKAVGYSGRTAGFFCLSNSYGDWVMYGTPCSIYTCTGQSFSSKSCLYDHNFAFRSPDSKYIYQLLSYHRRLDGEAYVVCYIAENTKEVKQIKEVVLCDTIVSWEINSVGLACALPHSDGKRMWIVTQKGDERTVYSYLVDGEDISLAEVTDVGVDFHIHYLEPKIVLPETGEIFFLMSEMDYHCVYYLKVDQTTGKVAAPVQLFKGKMDSFEISPNGDFFYSIYRNEVSRFLLEDLKKGKVTPQKYFFDDGHILTEGGGYKGYYMRLGIDGNIYMKSPFKMYAIKDPDSDTPSIDYVFDLEHLVRIGNTIQNYLRVYNTFSAVSYCDRMVSFTSMVSRSYSSIKWDFGDGCVLYDDRNPVHTFSRAGVYDVKMSVVLTTGETKDVERKIEVWEQNKVNIKWRRD